MSAQDHIDGRERQLRIQRRNNVLSAIWLAVWIIFAGIGLAATVYFVFTNVFQSGGRCDMSHECPIENCATSVRIPYRDHGENDVFTGEEEPHHDDEGFDENALDE